MATLTATARVIANFAWQHMKAATIFRDHVIDLEEKHVGQPFGAFFEEIRSYASACYLSSAASLEALINEFYIAHEGQLRKKLGDFEEEFWGNNGIERKAILTKYQYALRILSLPPLETHSLPYRDIQALIGLRNSLVHYKPNWDPDRKDRGDLIELLRGRFPLSPFIDEGADFVSMQCMSSGCTRWAVSSTLAFMRDFHDRAKLDPNKMEGFWKLLDP